MDRSMHYTTLAEDAKELTRDEIIVILDHNRDVERKYLFELFIMQLMPVDSEEYDQRLRQVDYHLAEVAMRIDILEREKSRRGWQETL